MDFQQTLNTATKLAEAEKLVIEASEGTRAEAYANGRYDLFDETTEDMVQHYRKFTDRMLSLLQTGTDPGP